MNFISRLKVRNSEKGFTLVEVLVVLVILAILVAIAMPLYTDYVRDARASEAKTAIGAIWNSSKMYYQNFDVYPRDVDEVIREGMLELEQSVTDNWTFTIIGGGTDQQPKDIQAISTANMKGGEGKEVTYNVEKAVFAGYGMPAENE